MQTGGKLEGGGRGMRGSILFENLDINQFQTGKLLENLKAACQGGRTRACPYRTHQTAAKSHRGNEKNKDVKRMWKL